MVLKFNTSVAEDFVISTLRNAIKNGKLGDLSINVSSIEGISPVNTSTAAPPTNKATSPKPDGTFINFQVILLVYLFVVLCDGKLIP